ncbi:NACHT domain-containing protein, partial [Gigaspora margarita]
QKESHYRFIHKSLQEYFVARAIYEACIQPSATPADTVQKTLLGQHNLVGDPNILRFLVEFAQQGEQAPVFKAHLHDLIEYSKTDEAGGIAAANAMTILVKAGVQFNGADLKGIRIPGADLSYGVFDQAQFDGADLRDVNFSTAWLREAYFNNAKMDKVRFGEWPFIELKTPAYACAYSPDGKEAAIATGQEIKIYDAQTLKEKRTLSGHTDTVWSVVYSPNGEQIASGSDDKTVRLWDAKTGKALAVIQGFHGGVYSVASDTAPDGGWRLLTGGSDKAVRLWQVKEPVRPGEPCLVALCWTSTQAVLTALKMNLQGVQGLSEMNASLLAQRGAVGKPSSQTQTAQSSQPQSSNLISRLFLRPLESFTASVRGSSASSATPSGSSLFSSQTTSTPLGPGQLA